MNIREIIERLRELSAELPEGLDSEVRVSICNGHDSPGLMTPSVEVHPMYEQHVRTLEVRSSWVALQGHPHRDEDNEGSVMRPMTMDIDDVVQRWAAEQAGDAPSASDRDSAMMDYVVDPHSGTRFVALHRPGQKSIRMELGDGGKIRYVPGAPEAVVAGCLCDPNRNNQGDGAGLHDDRRTFIVKDGCPLHEQIDPPS